MKSAQHFGWLFLSLLFASLTACQHENAQSTNATQTTGTGRVGVLLTDAPASTQIFEHIYVTITGIDMRGKDEGDASSGNFVLFSGSQKVDLLRLADFSELFAFADNIPAGDYHKIRLTISELELVTAEGSVFPKLPANGKIDLNPRGTFRVEAGQTLLIQLDVDAEKSIHIVETGKGNYNFRPVIFVDVITTGFPGKLMRRTGYVQHLDLITGHFALCAAPRVPDITIPLATSIEHNDDVMPCIGVSTNETSVFDESGAPTLTSKLANDQRVTVIGFLMGHFDHEHADHTMFAHLGAEVIEIGGANPWVVQRGAVGSAPADAMSTFTLSLDEIKALKTQLQTGTKVFSRNGTRLSAADISVGMEATVDGVFDANDATLLHSSLVVLNTGSPLSQTSGTIQTINYSRRELTITTDTGDITLAADDATAIFLFGKTSAVTGVTQIQFAGLKDKQTITAFGVAELSGVFHARVILAEAL